MQTQTDKINSLYPTFSELKRQLPEFCEDYFIGKEAKLNINSRVAYARELLLFFTYITKYEESFKEIPITEFSCDDLKRITYKELQRYFSYMRNRSAKEIELNKESKKGVKSNGSRSMNRKMSILNDFFDKNVKKGLLPHNPMDPIERDTIKEKPIVIMDNDDSNAFFHNMKYGDSLTDRQKAFAKRTYERDYAIFTLLADTGMRVSELVNIDLDDIYFEQHMIKIMRKGDKEDTVYMSDAAQEVIQNYISCHRKKYNPKMDEKALFVSLRGTRITARSVEKLAEKYAQCIPDKKISPHRFRSTYGTKLYKETNGDLLSVAKILGHSSTDVTQKHYTQYPEERKESLRNL